MHLPPRIVLHVGAALVLLAIALDGSSVRRTVALVALAALAVLYLGTRRTELRCRNDRRVHAVLDALPTAVIDDARVYDIAETSPQYTHVRANGRVMRILSRLRALRKFNDHAFARAVTYIDYLLGPAQRPRARFTAAELVMLKDAAVNALHEFVFCVPPAFQRDMRLQSKLRALDAVLYAEAIAPRMRSSEVFPLPNGGACQHLFAGF